MVDLWKKCDSRLKAWNFVIDINGTWKNFEWLKIHLFENFDQSIWRLQSKKIQSKKAQSTQIFEWNFNWIFEWLNSFPSEMRKMVHYNELKIC